MRHATSVGKKSPAIVGLSNVIRAQPQKASTIGRVFMDSPKGSRKAASRRRFRPIPDYSRARRRVETSGDVIQNPFYRTAESLSRFLQELLGVSCGAASRFENAV